MNLDYYKDAVIKVYNAPLLAISLEWFKNMKFSKGDELKIEMTVDRSLRITPISTGPARSEGNGCASPN